MGSVPDKAPSDRLAMDTASETDSSSAMASVPMDLASVMAMVSDPMDLESVTAIQLVQRSARLLVPSSH